MVNATSDSDNGWAPQAMTSWGYYAAYGIISPWSVQMSSISSPTTTIAITERHVNGELGSLWGSDISCPTWHYNENLAAILTQSAHIGKMVFAFSDGHVSPLTFEETGPNGGMWTTNEDD